MNDNLYIRLSSKGAQWMLMNPDNAEVRLRGDGELIELVERLQDITFSGETFVLVATDEVLLTHANVPSKQMRQIMQAVPFVIEEQLASDVEDCHFAVGERLESGDISVAVIDRELISAWCESLSTAGLSPRLMLVDVLQVPWSGGVSLLVDGQRLLMRTGKTSGYSFSADQLALAVGLSAPAEGDQMVIYADEGARAQIALAVSQVNVEYGINCELRDAPTSGFEWLCEGLDPRGLNLLQGEFRAAPTTQAETNIWRSVAVLAMLAFGLHLAVVLGQGLYLEYQADQFEAASLGLYKEIFPEDRNVRDLRRRWRVHLGASSGDNVGFVSLFADAAEQLQGSNLVLNNVNYNANRGDLILQVQAPRSEQLVSFTEALTARGLNAEIGTISQEENQVKGSIKVRSGGGAS
jgi:general secretion pathway protein L